MNKYSKGKNKIFVKRGREKGNKPTGKYRFSEPTILPYKMKIDHNNLKDASRQIFEKTALTVGKQDEKILRDGTTLEDFELFFTDYLVNGKRYLEEDVDKYCDCIFSGGAIAKVNGRCFRNKYCVTYKNNDMTNSSWLEIRY